MNKEELQQIIAEEQNNPEYQDLQGLLKLHKLKFFLMEQIDLKSKNLVRWDGNLPIDAKCRLQTQIDTLKTILEELER